MNKSRKTLTVLESNRLLDELLVVSGTFQSKKKAIRNYLIGLLLCDSGLRVSEVVSLKRSDLIFNNEPVKSITVLTKKKRVETERVIPLTGRIQRAITKMHDIVWPVSITDLEHYAFYASDFRSHLTTRQVERIIFVASLCCLNFAIHPHTLRHTFATRLMRTTNIRTVQELLGHSHLSSTQVYTHPDFQDLTKAIEGISDNSVR